MECDIVIANGVPGMYMLSRVLHMRVSYCDLPGWNEMRERRVFVVGAYLARGGTFMAYQLARILHEDFGLQGIAVTVGDETPGNGIFDYSPLFPSIGVEEMEASISDDDILIANPSFSPFCFGFKCRGRKVMYIQGFTTFTVLDCRFDHYVSVSGFIRTFISGTYGIDTAVVPPFIRADKFPPAPPWRSRPPASIVVSLKGDHGHQQLILNRVRQLVARRLPDIRLDDVLAGKIIPQHELLARIGQSRHFLTLSAAEGYPLLPLEAMAMGTTLLGFDGFGGRDYMQPGINCAVTAYPDIEGLADRIVDVLNNPQYAETLAEAGRATANDRAHSYERFRAAWREQFSQVLGVRA